MPESAIRKRIAPPVWLWSLAPILLAATLTIPLLNVDAYNGDEIAHLESAGILETDPRTLGEVWENTAPRVGPGWPILISIQARLAGWSEIAVRSLALFAGLLTLALVYRAGKEMFSATGGVIATTLLAASVFHLAYMVRAGPYAGVALFAILTVCCYWKVARAPGAPGKLAQIGLFLGSAGLLYVHYLASLILPLIALYHVFLVPKRGRWLNTALLFALAALAGAFQLPLIQRGLTWTAIEELGSRVLTVNALLLRLLSNFSNGILDASTPAGKALPLGLILVTVAGLLKYLRNRGRESAWRYTAFLAVSFLLLIILINEQFRIIVNNRIRYLMPLLPLGALLAGAVLGQVPRQKHLPVLCFLAFWLCLGSWLVSATSFRYETGYFFRSRLHQVAAALNEQIQEEDGLVVRMDHRWQGIGEGTWAAQAGKLRFAFAVYPANPDDVLKSLLAARSAHPYVWLLRHQQTAAIASGKAFEAGLFLCERALDQWGYRLELYTGTGSRCPGQRIPLEFEQDIRLGGATARLGQETLHLEVLLSSSDEYLLARYSLALHVIDPRSGGRVAQGDVGVGPGTYVSLRSDIDISALSPGDYEVHVALYDWQSGERLIARNPGTGEVSDMHVLHRFNVD